MARGWHYTKVSLSSALLLFFFWHDVHCVVVPFFLSVFCFVFVLFLFCFHALIFSSPVDHVPDWQPGILLDIIEAHNAHNNSVRINRVRLPILLVVS